MAEIKFPELDGVSFTEKDIDKAVDLQNVNHPVLDLLEMVNNQFPNYQQENKAQYLERLTEAFEEIGEFNLSPLELISIWSKLLDIGELNNRGFRYEVTSMMALAYATSTLESPVWDGIIVDWMTTADIYDRIKDDSEFNEFKRRLDIYVDFFDEINNYRTGTPKRIDKLLEYHVSGDPDKIDFFQKVVAREKNIKHSELLGEIDENSVNGYLAIYLNLKITHGQGPDNSNSDPPGNSRVGDLDDEYSGGPPGDNSPLDGEQ